MPKEEEFGDVKFWQFLRSQNPVLPPKIKNFHASAVRAEKGAKLQFIGKLMMQIW